MIHLESSEQRNATTLPALVLIEYYKKYPYKNELNQRGKVRRARIFYFRELTDKKAKIKELRRK